MLQLLSVIAAAGSVEFFALRHGQSLANVEGIISSSPDVAVHSHGLSLLGWEQAEAAGEDVFQRACRLGAGVALVCSDFKRAKETAQAVHKRVRAAGMQIWPAEDVALEVLLRERDFGELDGTGTDGYDRVWALDAHDAHHTSYGVESVIAVRERVRQLLLRLSEEPSFDTGDWMVILVAHGDVLQIAQTLFAEIPGEQHRTLDHLETATLRQLGPLPAAALRS